MLDYYEHALWRADAAWLRKEKSRQSSKARSQRNLAAGFLFMGGKRKKRHCPGKTGDDKEFLGKCEDES
ncbi:MAG TPA: hypothetical protein VNJ12_05120 [Candidatus Dormibacteraeota bacterium]|nr:hypothetical protein [Candidatus Dormibacteraeota bacterium]